MRVNELRELGSGDLSTRLDEVKEELFNLRFQNATGQLENFKRLNQLKRDVARISTVVRERELGIEIEPKDLPPPRVRRRKKDEEETGEGSISDAADADEVQPDDLADDLDDDAAGDK